MWTPYPSLQRKRFSSSIPSHLLFASQTLALVCAARGQRNGFWHPHRSRLRDLVLLNYAGNQQVTSQNCNCYPHLFRCSTIKYHKLLSTFVERPLCCLAFHHILHCSVFKVQFPVSLETRSKRTTSCPLPSIFNSKLVEIVGIEPATSCLQGRRSPS